MSPLERLNAAAMRADRNRTLRRASITLSIIAAATLALVIASTTLTAALALPTTLAQANDMRGT